MCIICNLPDPASQVQAASHFLSAYSRAQKAMREAERAMLAVSDLDLSPEDKKRYRATHKALVRTRRQWNRIEHTREARPVQHEEAM